MENVASGLKETELKQSNAVLQWKGLLDHLDSTRNALHTGFEELQDQFVPERKSIRARNQELEDRENELEGKVLNFNSEMESKAKELHGIERLIEEKRNEVGVKEKRLLEIEILVREKERDSDFIQKCIEERTEKLNWYRKDIELKERQLKAVKGSIEEGKKVFDWKQEQVKAAHKSLEECHKEIKLEMEKLSLIQKPVFECSNTLGSGEKIIRNMELKVRDFGLVKKSMEEWSCKVGVKERELGGWVEKLEFREKQIESKVEELNLIESRVNQCLNEVQLKEKYFASLGKLTQERQQHLDSQEKSLEEFSHGLKMKERQLGEQAKELELKQRQFDSSRKSTEDIQNLNSKATELCQSLGITDMAPVSRTISVPVEIEELDSSPITNTATSSPNLQLSVTADARNSEASPNEQLGGNNSILNHMFLALRMSVDPAKLVLKVMQISFAEYWRKGNVNFEATFLMNKMSMLKELTKVLPHVGPHVKEDAMRLAVQWQAKMRAETVNSLEILVFLHFIATYGLLATFNGDEIVKLLGIICQHKQGLELCQTHGLADKIPDFVQTLVERRQLIEAVRFTCTFKLVDKFPPVPLVIEYVEDRRKFYRTRWREKKSLDEKDEVLDNQIADLRAVIQCTKDNNLESEFPSNAIEAEIVLLEKLKENWRSCSVPSVACEQVEQEQEKGKKRSASSFAFDQPPQQCESKRLQKAI